MTDKKAQVLAEVLEGMCVSWVGPKPCVKHVKCPAPNKRCYDIEPFDWPAYADRVVKEQATQSHTRHGLNTLAGSRQSRKRGASPRATLARNSSFWPRLARLPSGR